MKMLTAMTIEHRYSARIQIELQVQLQYRNRRFFSARGRNLSDQGMYLEIQNLALPTGTLIGAEFQCLGRCWSVEAVVIHQDPRGIGIMFREPQSELFRGLDQAKPKGIVLRQSSAPSPQSLPR